MFDIAQVRSNQTNEKTQIFIHLTYILFQEMKQQKMEPMGVI